MSRITWVSIYLLRGVGFCMVKNKLSFLIFLSIFILSSCSKKDISAEKDIVLEEPTPIQAPSNLIYQNTIVTYFQNIPITPNAPRSELLGGVGPFTYTAVPSLPEGLNLDSTSGVISGAPRDLMETRSSFSIRVSNAFGSVSSTITIRVIESPPISLNYQWQDETFLRGRALFPMFPEVVGNVSGYSVSPSLPEGMMLDPDTGVIGGTPSSVQNRIFYTVSASNSSGSKTYQFSLKIEDEPPTDLVYPVTDMVLRVNDAMVPNTPTSEGGEVTFYLISPSKENLPAGLFFNPVSGEISGTPLEEIETPLIYTVTAINSGVDSGLPTSQIYLDASTQISIKILSDPPDSISYTQEDFLYTLNQSISPNISSYQGGKPTLYEVNPSLPAGLALDANFGTITGIPTQLSPKSIYSVTASNSGGSVVKNISLGVIDIPPSQVAYEKTIFKIRKDESFSIDITQNQGGPITSFNISPPLPVGISLNTQSGQISGIPLQVTQSKVYTITAINSGGTFSFPIDIEVLPVPDYDFAVALVQKQRRLGFIDYTFELTNTSREAASPSILVNGSFNSSLGSWIDDSSSAAVAGWDSGGGGRAQLTNPGDNGVAKMSQGITGFTSGKIYRVRFKLTKGSYDKGVLVIVDKQGADIQKNFSGEDGIYDFTFTADASSQGVKFSLEDEGAGNLYIDDISVQKISEIGVFMALPFVVDPLSSGIIVEEDAGISTCFGLVEEEFVFLSKCIIKVSYQTPGIVPGEITFEIKASTVKSKLVNLLPFLDITPTQVNLTSSDRLIRVQLIQGQEPLINTSNPAIFDNVSSLSSSILERSNTYLDAPTALLNEFVGSSQNLVSKVEDPDEDGVDGFSLHDNRLFTASMLLTANMGGFTSTCLVEIPFELEDCSLGSFNLASEDLTYSGSFQARVGVEEGLAEESAVSNSLSIDVYRLKRLATTNKRAANIIPLGGNVYFAGLLDKVALTSRKLLKYAPATGQVSQVSRLTSNNDDRAFPFYGEGDNLFIKGKNPLGPQQDTNFYVYSISSHKIMPLNSDLLNFKTIDSSTNPGGEVFSFVDDKFYFQAKLNGEIGLFSYNKNTNTIVREVRPLFTSPNASNGLITPTSFVKYNNKYFFEMFIHDGSQGGGKLVSYDNSSNVVKRVTNRNGQNNGDKVSKPMVFNNKLYFKSNSISGAPDFSFYDDVSTKFTRIFAGDQSPGQSFGSYYSKIFFSMDTTVSNDTLYYFDGSNIVGILELENDADKFVSIDKFYNQEGLEGMFFLVYESLSDRHVLYQYKEDSGGVGSLVRIADDDNQIIINSDISMFSYDQKLFFSCGQLGESLCVFEPSSGSLLKLADNFKFNMSPSYPGSHPKGIVFFENRMYLSTEETSQSVKPGVYELCRLGQAGCE